jgi:hypothetical protein
MSIVNSRPTQALFAEPDELGPATRGLLLICGMGAAWVAAFAGLLPAATSLSLPWPVAPLHARCIAALHAAAALTWLLGSRQRDPAAVRIPLGLALGNSWAYVLQLLVTWPTLAPAGGAAWLWMLVQAGTAASSMWLLLRQRELRAPAERLDAPLVLCGAFALASAALLALKPDWAAAVWPWPLSRQAAVLYAAALAGWALALFMLARERRRAARSLTLLGLVVAGPLVAGVSWWQRDAFYSAAQGAAWAALFLMASALACWRLRTLALRHRRRAS